MIDPLRPHSPGVAGQCPDCSEARDAEIHTVFPRQVRSVRWSEIRTKIREADGQAIVVALPPA